MPASLASHSDMPVDELIRKRGVMANGKTIRRLLVCGDRGWGKTTKALEQARTTILLGLSWFIPGVQTIIEGGARGVDEIAGQIAEELGLEHIKVDADWDKFGLAAGPLRNAEMLVDYQPDAVLYFHADLTFSKGTKNCVDQAKQLGIAVFDGIALSR